MQRLTLAGGIPEHLRGSIVALGNFDGFHLGHQAVVSRAVARAFHERRPVIVATFDPHPVRFFKPNLPPFRLTTLDQRESLFAHAGADAMLVFEFGAELASMDAEAFIAEVLAKRHCSQALAPSMASSPRPCRRSRSTGSGSPRAASAKR
jgi:riboflavin kinase/FMN adenylyltransferase